MSTTAKPPDDDDALNPGQQAAQDAAVIDALLADDAGGDPAGRRTILDSSDPPTAPGPAASNATMLDDDSAPKRQSRSRVNLPAALAERFEIVKTITSGAEADVLVVRNRATDELRAIKLYRDSVARVDEELLAAISRSDREHVVETHGRDREGGEWWEELEYCPEGSLADRFARENSEGHGLPVAHVREIVDELIPAIAHLHTLSSEGKPVVHRDLKPANILVRSVEPRLDLVIADFGLARLLDATRDMRSRSRTIEYAAPESSWGEVSPARDWWSLGIMIVELSTGRHPFVHEDGSIMEPAAIEAHIQRRPVDVSDVPDTDLRTLAKGLLVRDPEHRWGANEVAAWQRGEAQPIHDTRFVRRRGAVVFLCGESEYASPEVLAEAWSQDWDEGAAVMAGSSELRRERRALRDFLASCDFTGDDIQRLNAIFTEEDASEHRRLVELLRVLDPELPPVYRGRPVDPENLRGLAASAAKGDPSALEVLDTLASDEVLRLFAGSEGCERYTNVEQQWQRQADNLVDYLDPVTESMPGRDDAMLARLAQTAQAVLLVMLLEGPGSSEVGTMLSSARSNPDALEVKSYVNLACNEQPGMSAGAALIAVEPTAARLGATIRETREAKERERRDRERSELHATLRRAALRATVASLVAAAGLFLLALRFSFTGWSSFPGGFQGAISEPGTAVVMALWPITVACCLLCSGAAVAHDALASRSKNLEYLGKGRRLAWTSLLCGLVAAGVAALGLPGSDEVRSLHSWGIALAAYAAAMLIAIASHAVGGLTTLKNTKRRARASATLGGATLLAASLIVVTALADQRAIDSEAAAWRSDSALLVGASRSDCTAVPFNASNPYATGMRAQMSCRVLATPVVVSWFRDHPNLAAYNNAVSRPITTNGTCRHGEPQAAILRVGRFYCYFDGGSAHTDWSYDPALVLAQTTKPAGSLRRTYQVYHHFDLDYRKVAAGS